MADDRYSIPWAPPDIGPGVSMIMSAINANRADERSRAYLDMEQQAVKDRAERESAALARQKEQDQYNRDVAAFTAMPALQRAAMKSVGMANMNPYGVKFDEGKSHAPSLRESGINIMGGNEQYAEHAKQALAGDITAETLPVDATVGQHSGAPSVPMGQHSGTPQFEETGEPSPHDETAEAEVVSPPIAAAQALIGQPRQRQVFATYKGQRFEIPPTHETTGLGDKYDAIYRTMLEIPGVTQQHAMDKVLADYEKDQAESGRTTRMQNMLGFRNNNREDIQAFQAGQNEKYKLTFDQRKQLAEIMAHAKVAAAGAQPIPPGLATLVGMKEAGATDEEVYAKAAQLHLTEKQVVQPVQNVVRNAAAGERAGQKREALTATDAHGQVIGTWKDATAARTGAKQIESFNRVQMRLHELIDDVARTGNRVLTPEEIQQRVSKGESVVAALRPYNELGSTDASVKMEAAIVGALGAPGHGFLMGANPSILQRLLKEAEDQHRAQLGTKLRPGGGSQLAPALGGPRHSGGQGGGLPAGAIPGTMNGKRGYALNGEFHATE